MPDLSPARTDRAIAASIAIVLFTIYAFGACQTIYVGDSGELVTAVAVLGIPHPSGYPLYVLLGKLWTLLVPIGSIAFRMSLFSAACAAAACSLLFTTVRQDGGTRVAALLASGLLAFGPSFWHEANIQRVYALNALFLVLAINRALAWYRSRRHSDLVVTMLICGVGAANHTVMALAGIAVAIWAPTADRSLFRKPKIVAACAAAFFVGLLPYIYLPLRARMNPILNWGEPKTLEAFLAVVLRKGYWERAWWQGAADLIPVSTDWARSLAVESGFLGLTLALIALARVPIRKSLLLILVLAFNLLALARHGSFNDIFMWHRYYIPSYAMVALLAAWGLEVVRVRFELRRLAAAVLLIPVLMFATGYRTNDHSGPSVANEFAHRVLDSLPPGARVLTTDDNVLFPLLYLKWAEGLRADVTLIPMGVDQQKQSFAFDPDIDPTFFTHKPSWSLNELAIIPVGVVFEAIRAGRPLPDIRPYEPLPGTDDVLARGDYLSRILVAHHEMMYAMSWEYRDWTKARPHLEKAFAAAPNHDLAAYNVGMIYSRNGFFDEALFALARADALNPRGGIDIAFGKGTRRYSARAQIDIVKAKRDQAQASEQQIAARLTETPRGSVSWHLEMARQLLAGSQPEAARRQRLIALGQAREQDRQPEE